MSFYSDLQFGLDSERRLLSAYPCLTAATDKTHDFIITGTKIKIEKKVDSYHPAKYSNIIIERFSREEKPGGPWQSKEKGCRYYIYMFAQTNDVYVFDIIQLIARVKKLVKKNNYKLFNKENISWTTRYYKIPIAELLDINVGMEKLEKLYNQAEARRKKRVKK